MRLRKFAGGFAGVVLLASSSSGFASDRAPDAAQTLPVRAFSSPLGQETSASLPKVTFGQRGDRTMSFADAVMQNSAILSGSRGLPAVTSLLEGMGFAVPVSAIFFPDHLLAGQGAQPVASQANAGAADAENGRVCKSEDYVDANGNTQRRNTCTGGLLGSGAGLFSGAGGIVAAGLGLGALAIMAASSSDDAQTPVSSL